MTILSRMERKFGRFAIPHVTLGLIVCQVLAYAFIFAPRLVQNQEPFDERLFLIPRLVLDGELWRLATFLVVPPFTNFFFAFFFWYLFYLMGTSLERHWGAFRYNVYLLIGYVATVSVSFLTPDSSASNGYLQASVFLAFAFLYPEFELYIFFLLPVKIKWLALLTWIGYGLTVALGDWSSRLLVLASVANFLLFFGSDILERIRIGRRRMAVQAANFAVREKPYFHRCLTCGTTDRTHPNMEFRYCSKCAGNCCYCMEHLKDHEHVAASEKPPVQ